MHAITTLDEWSGFLSIALQEKAEFPWEFHFLGTMDSSWKAGGLEAFLDTSKLTVQVCHFGEHRRCAWGRYLNMEYVYTLPSHRRQGHARRLALEVQEEAVRRRGCNRVRSMITTYPCYRWHLSLGHEIWGRDTDNSLLVDSPLTHERFPDTVPRHARSVCKDVATKPSGETVEKWAREMPGFRKD